MAQDPANAKTGKVLGKSSNYNLEKNARLIPGNSEVAMQKDLCSQKETGEMEEQPRLSLISWNIDGLDGEKQPERARGLCSSLIS